MEFFNILPGTIRYQVGLEWPLLKNTPFILFVGTALILTPIVLLYLNNPTVNPAQYKTIYLCVGLLFNLWFFVGVLAIACLIMVLMKGPAYVADSYELPKLPSEVNMQD